MAPIWSLRLILFISSPIFLLVQNISLGNLSLPQLGMGRTLEHVADMDILAVKCCSLNALMTMNHTIYAGQQESIWHAFCCFLGLTDFGA